VILALTLALTLTTDPVLNPTYPGSVEVELLLLTYSLLTTYYLPLTTKGASRWSCT
jgi:hypothetical protein